MRRMQPPGIWCMVPAITTHPFVPYLPRGNHEGTDEAAAALAGGTRVEGHRRPLEGGRPLSSLRRAQAPVGAEAIGTKCEPKGAGAATSRDGGAWPRSPRDLPAGPAARRLLGDASRS